MRDRHPLPGTDYVVEDRRVHVVRHGRDGNGGLPLMLIHGLPTSSYLWRDVMRDLEHHVPTVAPDLIGLGHSEKPRVAGYDFPAQARLLLALLDRLDMPRVVLAGHVLGGAVAVHLTALAPERVAGLALLGTPVHPDVWPVPVVLPLTLPGIGQAYASGPGRALARRLLAAGLGANGLLPPEVLRRYATPLLTPDGARGLVRFVQSVDPARTQAAWDRVRMAAPPTLLLWGTEDRVHSLAYGRRLADEMPSASWVPLAGRGHLLPEECPERIAEELAGFRAELGSPAGSRRPAGSAPSR